jgi:arylsulfatase A-like enzyme
MMRAYANVMPTLPTRIALYTGMQVYPYQHGDVRLQGDLGFPAWGPIPEEWPTLAEILSEAGYRTGLISDLYHMFKPSKNFWRGFHQWSFLRGQELDPMRSGPHLASAEVDDWLPKELRHIVDFRGGGEEVILNFIQQCIMNIHGRQHEVDYFSPRVFQEASLWLEQNQDAEKFFLTIESFDPHEPWLIPPHYRKMYLKEDGQEQVITSYSDVSLMDRALLERTRANYFGSVSLCDRWFGYFMETLRVLGLLDNTMVIFTSDHGHSLGEENYLGKRGYPSRPEVFEVPLMIRFPGAEHAGATSEMFVQHVDLTATILKVAGVEPPIPIDGQSFLDDALAGYPGSRDHVTIGWGSTPTVVTDRWWFNCKFDGTGVFLYDLQASNPFSRNVADEYHEVVNALFKQAKDDAGGHFPDWLVELAQNEADAPGCSLLANANSASKSWE